MRTEDYVTLGEFRYSLRRFLRFSKDYLRAAAGLTPEQYEALLAIKAFNESRSLNISELSERLQVKHHSAISIVDRLADQNLIRREPSATDRRKRHLELTVKGEEVIEELGVVHRNELRARSAEMIKLLERLRE